MIKTVILCLVVGLASGTSRAALPEFTDLVKRAAPTVVNIRAERKARRSLNDRLDQEVPEFFRRFFPRNRPAQGSGFIISKDGYILTNNHVVEDASEIVVSLNDRRERVAEVIGSDPLSDLALLKIDADDLPVVKFGKSELLQVGEWVVAIGSPFGFEHSVTAGIVSAKGRSLPESSGNYVPFIQTDVAINPGNSGGPLFNLRGEVVGINSQIFTRSGGFMGLSFAIPIDVALEVVEQLKDKGSVSRGWLGVQIQGVDKDLAESFGLDRPSGALVVQVFANSPAERAGLRAGDIITKFNNHKIDLSSDLPHVVGRTQADTEVRVEIVRNEERQTVDLVVGLLTADDLNNRGRPAQTSRQSTLGLTLEDMSAEERSRARVDDGIRVRRTSAGPAMDAGIRPGDIITMLNQEVVDSVVRFEDIVEGLDPGRTVPVMVMRNTGRAFLAIKVPG